MKTINSAYKFRLYPTNKQEEQMAKTFGCCRFLYNYFLNQRIEFYEANKEEKKKGLNYYDNARDLTGLKQEYPWLKESGIHILQHSLKHLEKAYRNFFRTKQGFPRFKSKDSKQSFESPDCFAVEEGRLYLPKFKEGVKLVQSREIEGQIKTVVVSKNTSGQYFVSLMVEREVESLPVISKEVGLDIGIKNLMISSDGEVWDNPKTLSKKSKKLGFLQRMLSKKAKKSGKRKKAKKKVARLHLNIRNIRVDNIHKITNQISNENQIIYIEDLNVKGMVRNHKLARSISDASFGEIRRQLEYKCLWKGRELVVIDRWFPSSKTCSSCGAINKELQLKDRSWTCSCGTVHDRDLNAAVNILNCGRDYRGKARGAA